MLETLSFEAVTHWLQDYLGVVGLTFGLLLGFALTMMLIRKRRCLVFPEAKVEQRLGAPHAAGIGAVISFSQRGLPPNVQRKQISGQRYRQ